MAKVALFSTACLAMQLMAMMEMPSSASWWSAAYVDIYQDVQGMDPVQVNLHIFQSTANATH
jgi:hypothetical protein